MNKLFIVLLIAVIGTGAFFLLQKKDNPVAGNEFNKDLIIGKWKVNNDSLQSMYNYEFQKKGIVLRSLNDAIKADTSYYDWSKSNELVWKEKPGDLTGSKVFVVTKLNADSLVIQSKDSLVTYFTKVK